MARTLELALGSIPAWQVMGTLLAAVASLGLYALTHR